MLSFFLTFTLIMGGLLSLGQGKPQLLFNAIYVASQSALMSAQPHYRDKKLYPGAQALLAKSKRLELVSGAGSQALGPSYR